MESTSELGENFRCLICLDLVFKPVVQSCGHVFCFWCVHRAMDSKRRSQCPVCRRPYIHFPRVCALLHHFLMKAVPDEYAARAREIQDMEESEQIFSPRIPDSPMSCSGSPRKSSDQAACKSPIVLQLQRHLEDVKQHRSGNFPAASMKKLLIPDTQPHVSSMHCARDNAQAMEIFAENDGFSKCNDILSVDDFSCASCNLFLYRPVVLNCGQALCESCIPKHDSSDLSCPSCRSPHPGGSLYVCLELHQYLERAFPADYHHKRPQKELDCRIDPDQQPSATKSSELEGTAHARSKNLSVEEQLAAGPLFVHQGIGCDECGMFPIVGDRYHCRDCAEKIGYDLCGRCVDRNDSNKLMVSNSSSLQAGRFNQQHSRNHRMELVKVSEIKPRMVMQAVDLNLRSGLIMQRRTDRQQQQYQQLLHRSVHDQYHIRPQLQLNILADDDFDDYIDSFMW